MSLYVIEIKKEKDEGNAFCFNKMKKLNIRITEGKKKCEK